MVYTDTEKTAVETSPLGGVTEPAEGGPPEGEQVAGVIGKGASKIGNILVPPDVRDKMSQGISKALGGETGGALNKARIKAREDELGQSPLPPKEGEEGGPVTPKVEEQLPEENAVVKDLKDEGGPPPVQPERLITEDPYAKYTKVGDEDIDAVMQAPMRTKGAL